jgi:adenosylcobyric acid synthase
MIQGTGSNAGKTTLVAGLCRLFANRGLRVAPFKSQNMSLNSFVTDEGGEIARSLAVQAAGARQRPIVHMNPLLLKPKADDVAQLIVHGRPLMDVSAADYYASEKFQRLKLEAIDTSIAYLRENYDLIIAEGAGSCAEPNLRRWDVVNMGAAHRLNARVFIAADIDQGGVFASFLGTMRVFELTEPKDAELVEGFLINKFRGDRSVLEPALAFAAEHAGRPVVGVLPYLPDIRLEEEDRIRERRSPNPEVDVAVLYLPHISNANDFDFIAEEPGVDLRYVRSADALGLPDAVIIPGTKNTTADLEYIRRTGLEAAVLGLVGRSMIVGVCGGFEMFGRTLIDEAKTESPLGTIPGMNLLDFDVEFTPKKTLVQRRYAPTEDNPFVEAGEVTGYEIHTGQVHYRETRPAYRFDTGIDGAVDRPRMLFGTFIHDIFSNPAFTRTFVNRLRERRKLPRLTGPLPRARDRMDESYEMLAAMLGELDVFRA